MAKEPLPLFPNQPKGYKQKNSSQPQAPFQQPQSASSQPVFRQPKSPPPSFHQPRSGLMSSGRGKLLATLGIIGLLLGILAEIVSIGGGYYNMQKTAAEASQEAIKAQAQRCNLATIGCR